MNKIKVCLFVLSLFIASLIAAPNLNAIQYQTVYWNGYGNGLVVFPQYYSVPHSLNYYSPGVNWGPGYYLVPKTNNYFVVPQPYYYFMPY